MHGKILVGTATRYIAGRNAAQTVYWRGVNSSSKNPQKFVKVLRTVQFEKGKNTTQVDPPARVTQEQNIRF